MDRLAAPTARLHAATVARVRALRGTDPHRHDDTGAGIAEYVVITAVVVTTAVVVLGIIMGKITDLANSIHL